MDDNVYKEKLQEAEHLRAFIQTCYLEDVLTVEFDGETKEQFDFYPAKGGTKIYSTSFMEKAEGFILGFHFGRR